MILILGCSFADPKYGDESWRWPNLLSERYKKLKNEAKIGTGPQHNLHILKSYVDKGINKNKDLLIFFVPEYFRTNFKYFKDNSDQTFSYATSIDKTRFNNMFEKKYGERILEWQTNWWKYYQLNAKNEEMDIIKIYSTIAYYTKYFKRSLIIPTDLAHTIKNREIDIWNILERSDITCPKDINLEAVTLGEGLDPEYGKDPRPNHLSDINHQVMYELLTDWIDNGVVPVNKFHKNTR